jgi:hypothetical protein
MVTPAADHIKVHRNGALGPEHQTAGAVITPRPARPRNQIPVFPAVAGAHEAERRAHAPKRIRVEHGISHLKNFMVVTGVGVLSSPYDSVHAIKTESSARNGSVTAL